MYLKRQNTDILEEFLVPSTINNFFIDSINKVNANSKTINHFKTTTYKPFQTNFEFQYVTSIEVEKIIQGIRTNA